MDRFHVLREFALSLSSTEDAHARLAEAIEAMSAVNDAYVEVAIAKDDALLSLQSAIADARAKQEQVEEQMHRCQVCADDNLANIPGEFSAKDIKFLPLDESEFPDREMTDEELVRFRIEHDIAEMPRLKETQAELDERRKSLKKQLEETRAVYGAILNKMTKMYEQLLSFAQKK